MTTDTPITTGGTISITGTVVTGGFETEQEKRERLYLGGVRPATGPLTRAEHLAQIKQLVALAWVNNIPMNGCGPQGWHRRLVKALNKPWWLLFLCNLKPFCQRHDIRYWVGGSEEERERADTEFLHGLEAEVAHKFALIHRWGVRYGDQTAHDNHEAVRHFGSQAWVYWKAEALVPDCDTCYYSAIAMHKEPCQSCLFDDQGAKRPVLERLLNWKRKDLAGSST